MIRMLGPDGQPVLGRLSSAEARLVVVTDGQCTLSHDRLAQVVTELVRNEAARGNLLLDQRLLDLQRTISQKISLHELDTGDESALALTWQQRALITSNSDTLLFDTARRSWWDASELRRRRVWRHELLAAAVVMFLLLVAAILVKPPYVGVSLETDFVEKANWTIHDGTAVSTVPGKEVVVWKIDQPWSRRKHSAVQCDRFEVSGTGQYVAGITSDGDLHVWRSADTMTLESGKVISGLSWRTELRMRTSQLIQFSPNDRWMLAAMEDGDIYVWNPAEGLKPGQGPLIRVATVSGNKAGHLPPHIAFSPSSDRIAIADGERKLFLLRPGADEMNSTAPIDVLYDSFGDPLWFAFSDDDEWLVWNQGDRTGNKGENQTDAAQVLAVWNIGTSKRLTVQAPSGMRADSLHFAYFAAFSPRAKWLVGRKSFAPFITWDLNKADTSVGTVSAGGEEFGTGSDRRPFILFSPTEEWVAGIANDNKLHLWRLSSPPGANGPSVFPAEYFGDAHPALAFSPNGTRVAAEAPDGEIYIWPLATDIKVSQPVGRQYANAQIQFSEDSECIYSADLRTVNYGRFDRPLELIADSQSAIQAVVPDQSSLVICATDRVIIAKRGIYLWGIPLWELKWPALAKPLMIPLPE
jgi:WD40 repeat protein